MKKTITEKLAEMKLGESKVFPCEGIRKCRSLKQMAYQTGIERESEGLRYSCAHNRQRTEVTVTVVKR